MASLGRPARWQATASCCNAIASSNRTCDCRATSNACVAALKRAGAKTVVIASFARVLDEALDLAAHAHLRATAISPFDVISCQ